MSALPAVTPLPPAVRGLPRVGAGLPLLRDPTAFFTRARARHGNTFLTDAFGFRLLCLFSPEGVQSLYAQQERDASFGLATYTLIKFKMPEELLSGVASPRTSCSDETSPSPTWARSTTR